MNINNMNMVVMSVGERIVIGYLHTNRNFSNGTNLLTHRNKPFAKP